jgi:hypothetical protein
MTDRNDRNARVTDRNETTDLATRLRAVWDGSTAFDVCHEAADEIDRLTADRDYWRAQAEQTYPGKGRRGMSRRHLLGAKPDEGADGPAALARDIRKNIPTEIAGIYCRQVVEPGPMAGMRLDDRQLDAAGELSRLWREALPGREAPGAYAGGGHAGTRHLSRPTRSRRRARRRAALRWPPSTRCSGPAGVRGVMVVEADRRPPRRLRSTGRTCRGRWKHWRTISR